MPRSSRIADNNNSSSRFLDARRSFMHTATSVGSFYPPTATTSSSFSTHHPATKAARPPLPDFPPSFQKHFAGRNAHAPSPLDLSTINNAPKIGRTDMPILSLTPSPSSTSYHDHDHHSTSNLHRRPSSPAFVVSPSVSRPVTPIIPLSPVTVAPLQVRAKIALKRLSSRWAGNVDPKEKIKARNRVEKELAGLEKERAQQARWEQDRIERETSEREEWDIGLRVWSPLRVDGARRSWARFAAPEKGRQPRRVGSDEEEAARTRKRKFIWAAVILFLLLLIGVTVGLLVTLLSKKTQDSASTSTNNAAASLSSQSIASASVFASSSSVVSSPSGTATVSAALMSASASAAPVINLASCIATFPPTNSSSYCTTCNEFLTAATNDFVDSTAATKGVGQALQFCGIRSVFESTHTKTDGSRGDTIIGDSLADQGWFKSNDGKVCTWGGITCDDSGKVVQLNLTYPSVPDTIPSSIGNLVALQTLSITGSTTAAIPSGSIPSSVYSLSNLTSFSITSTALSSAIPNTAFSNTAKLQSLVLLNNQGLGTSLPTGLGGSSLTTLIVNGQYLSGNQFSYLPKTLSYLDISYNSLTSLTTDMASALPSLKTLLAASNSLSSLPSSFPSTLQTLSLADNSGLSGTLSSDLCSSSALSKCSVNGTSVVGSTSTSKTSGGTTVTYTTCGVCTF